MQYQEAEMLSSSMHELALYMRNGMTDVWEEGPFSRFNKNI